MRVWDELRALNAGRLLTLWRESGKAAEEPLERALLCNAAVIAESCFFQDEPVFESPEAVLEAVTPREMEGLLRRLAEAGHCGGEENPAFDAERFEALRKEMPWIT